MYTHTNFGSSSVPTFQLQIQHSQSTPNQLFDVWIDDQEFDEVAVEDCDKSLSESGETNRTEGWKSQASIINLTIK